MVETQAQPEEQKKCTTCERMIDISKFRMHDIGCARSNYKCKECGEIVPKAEKEDHEATAHKEAICQFCKFTAIASKFGNHEEHCELRPKPCQYCSKLFPFEKFLDHVDLCGSRTEKCDECKRLIRNKDKQIHKIHRGQCIQFQAENQKQEETERMKAMEELQKFQEKEEAERKKAMAKKEEDKMREEARKAAEIQMMKQLGAQRALEFQAQQQKPQATLSKVLETGSKPNQPGGVSNHSSKANQPLTNQTFPSQRSSQQQQQQMGPRVEMQQPGKSIQTRSQVQQQPKEQPVVVNRKIERTKAEQAKQPVPFSQREEAKEIKSTSSKIQSQPERSNYPMPQAQSNISKIQNKPDRSGYPMPQNSQSIKPQQSSQHKSGISQEELDAQLIAQMLEEDESRMLAEQLQNEMYGGGGQNPSVSAASRHQQIPMDGGMDFDDRGRPVRAAQPQRFEQLIGGRNDDIDVDMDENVADPDIDEGNNPWLNAGRSGYRAMDLGATTRQDELERAIAASLQNQNRAYDEDEELARILEQSKHQK